MIFMAINADKWLYLFLAVKYVRMKLELDV